MKQAAGQFFDFQIFALAMNEANARLINSFPDRDTQLHMKAVNRTDRLNKARTVYGFQVTCEGYSEPFFARQPHLAVNKLMKMARITGVQQYINNMEAKA